MTYILLTKSGPSVSAISATIAGMGLDVIESPLLHYRDAGAVLPDAGGYDGIAFTSAAAIHFTTSRLSPFLHLPAYAVGDATAAAAASAGFHDIRTADGDGASLARLLLQWRPARILHLAGRDIAFDLAAALAPQGIAVDRVTAYAADAADDLSPEARAALDAGDITHILFFSPRAAGFFGTFIERHGLWTAIQRTTALCLSDNIAQQLASLPFRKVKVAAKPATYALLALIDA